MQIEEYQAVAEAEIARLRCNNEALMRQLRESGEELAATRILVSEGNVKIMELRTEKAPLQENLCRRLEELAAEVGNLVTELGAGKLISQSTGELLAEGLKVVDGLYSHLDFRSGTRVRTAAGTWRSKVNAALSQTVKGPQDEKD